MGKGSKDIRKSENKGKNILRTTETHLTHPPWTKSSPFRRRYFQMLFFVNEKFCIFIKISLKFVINGPIGNNRALASIMAWHRIGVKPLSEPMLIQFTDAYMRGDELKYLIHTHSIIFYYIILFFHLRWAFSFQIFVAIFTWISNIHINARYPERHFMSKL